METQNPGNPDRCQVPGNKNCADSAHQRNYLLNSCQFYVSRLSIGPEDIT